MVANHVPFLFTNSKIMQKQLRLSQQKPPKFQFRRSCWGRIGVLRMVRRFSEGFDQHSFNNGTLKILNQNMDVFLVIYSFSDWMII